MLVFFGSGALGGSLTRRIFRLPRYFASGLSDRICARDGVLAIHCASRSVGKA